MKSATISAWKSSRQTQPNLALASASTPPAGESMPPLYQFLLPQFLSDMDDIGRYGHEKYGKFSFHHRRELGDNSRGDHPRTTPEAIAEHAGDHFKMHLAGTLHDHFGTRRHQLAAVAFNAMMEYYFSGFEDEHDTPQTAIAGESSGYPIGSGYSPTPVEPRGVFRSTEPGRRY